MPKWIDLPPVWMVLGLAAMWGLALIAPYPEARNPLLPWIGGALAAAGVALVIWAALAMRRARTTVNPHGDPSALVTGGPFRFSRNPIYLADAMIMVGWALWLGALLPFLVIPVWLIVIVKRFIRIEEGRLSAAFGDDYLAWAEKTRRWF